MADFRDEEIVLEFQRRRRRMLLNFAMALILFAVGFAILQLADFLPTLPLLSKIAPREWSAFAIAQFVAGLVFALVGFQQYRCPACNNIPRAHDKYYFGVAIDPSHCPNCGARLN